LKLTSGAMPSWQKQGIAITSLLLVLAGLPMIFGFFCVTLVMTIMGERDAIEMGLVSFTLMMVTVGAGGITFWHSLQSLQGNISKPLYLPSAWLLSGIIILLAIVGQLSAENASAAGLFLPPILLVAAGLPPLLAISWFMNQRTAELTWRRGLVAFAGSATVSAFIAIILEISFPTVILALVFNLANNVINSLEILLEALARENIASAIASRGFIYVFIQIAIIAPLIEELVKPLVTLPLIGRLSRRNAFLVGAMAGAGFATLENVLYASFGFFFWPGILIVKALGGAIHPLNSGLVALGWRGILRGEANAWLAWFRYFGLAVGMHTFWNAGSLLVIMMAGAQFSGDLPAGIDLLGLSAIWATLVLLIGLGLVALWIGRSITQKLKESSLTEGESTEVGFTLSDRATAIWALICLAALAPAGIAGLQILVK
jgi:RsiW-degrading membrane proteinase PrsW (M82 family)